MDENGLIVWYSTAYVTIDRWCFIGGKPKFLRKSISLFPKDTLRIQYVVKWGPDADDTVPARH